VHSLTVVRATSYSYEEWQIGVPELRNPKPTVTNFGMGDSKKGKGFPYSLPSVGPGAHPGVQAVSPQVTISHPLGGRLPLLSARPAVTFPAAEHHCPYSPSVNVKFVWVV